MSKFIFSKQKELDKVSKKEWDEDGNYISKEEEENKLLKERQDELKRFVKEECSDWRYEIVQEGREFLQVWNEEDLRSTIQNIYFDYESEMFNFINEVWKK